MALFAEKKPGFRGFIRYYFYDSPKEEYEYFKEAKAKLPPEERQYVGSFVKFLRHMGRYGACARDYFELRMYRYKHCYNKNFITYPVSQRILAKVNDPEYCVRFYDKKEFFKYYGDKMGRTQIDYTCSFEEFEAFVREYPRFFTKPDDMCMGYGAMIVDTDEKTDIRALYEKLTAEHRVFQPVLTNHPDLARLYPHSLNTIRATTVNFNGEPVLLAADLRTGQKGSIVDNFSAGGVCAVVNVENGVICGEGIDMYRSYFSHPDTGVAFPGFQIPCWDEVRRLVLDSARAIPQVKYIGWDVAVTPDGPVFVEANDSADIRGVQDDMHRPLKDYFYEEMRKMK